MNIVFIINSLCCRSGTERVACQLATLFVEQLGYTVSIVNRDTDYKDTAYALDDRVSVMKLQGGVWSFLQQTKRYIKSCNPDFVIVHNMGKLFLLCACLGINSQKLIVFEHVAFASKPFWVKMLSKVLYANVGTVIALTYADCRDYAWHKNSQVIYNISPYDIINKKTTYPKKLIYVGRFTYQKNIMAMLIAWQEVQTKLDGWVFELYGVGEEFASIKEHIANRGIPNVTLKGEATQMSSVYLSASVFVLSSRYEGLPMVLIEAQSFGLPIVAFDCPHGPAEIVSHKHNGMLVANQDTTKLAYALLTLLSNRQLIEQYSAQALQDACRFEPSVVLKKWRDLLEKQMDYLDKK